MNYQIKIKNQAVVLPKEWKMGKVSARRFGDTIVIKRAEEPVSKLSEIASRISSAEMTPGEIEKEIKNYRKNK